MTDCLMQPIEEPGEDGLYRCQCQRADCGKITPPLKNPCHRRRFICFAESPEGPGVGMTVLNFVKAAAKHLRHGMPLVSDETLAARYEVCVICEHFDGVRCKKCGCSAGNKGKRFNKLGWAGEECPVGKW